MECDSVHTAVEAAIVSVVSARYCGGRKNNAKLNVKLIFLTLSQIIRGRVKEEDGKIVHVHKIKWFLLRKRGQSTSGMDSLTTCLKKVAQ